MQQLIAELTRPMVLSDRTLRQLAQLKRAHHEYVRHHGHEPTGAQLASDTGMSREQVSDLLALERVPQSLDQPVSKGEGELGTFGELLVDPLAGDAYEQLLDHSEIEQVRALMGSLNDGSGQSCAAATVSTVPSNPCARSAIASASAANGGARSNSEPSANFAQPPVHSRHRDRRAVLSSTARTGRRPGPLETAATRTRIVALHQGHPWARSARRCPALISVKGNGSVAPGEEGLDDLGAAAYCLVCRRNLRR